MRILECPFCGSSCVSTFDNTCVEKPFCVQCRECFAIGPISKDEQEAITLWNASFSVHNGKTAEEWYRLYKDAIKERHQ